MPFFKQGEPIVRTQKIVWPLALVVVVSGLWLAQSLAQAPQRGQRGQRGWGEFDPERMRQWMEERRQANAERLKQVLDVSEEEWKEIEPAIDAVQKAQRNLRAGFGRRGGFGGFGGRGFGGRGPGGPASGGRGPGGPGFGGQDAGGPGPDGRGAGGRGRGGRGRDRAPGRGNMGPGMPGFGDEEPSELAKKTDALRALLDKGNAKAAQLKSALAAVRTARKKAEKQLADARADLNDLLNLRQEAEMVLMGYLE